MIEKIKEFLSGEVEIFGRKVPKILLVGLALVVGFFLFLKSKGSAGETFKPNSSTQDSDTISPTTIDSGTLQNSNQDFTTDSGLSSSSLGDIIEDRASFLDNKNFGEFQDSVAPLGDYSMDNTGYYSEPIAESKTPDLPYFGSSDSGFGGYTSDTPVVASEPVNTSKNPTNLRSIQLPNVSSSRQPRNQTISPKENPLSRVVDNIKNYRGSSNTQQSFINRGVTNFVNQAKGNNVTTYNPFNNAMNILAQNKGNQGSSNKPNLPPKNQGSNKPVVSPKPIVAPKLDTKTKLPPKKK